jgi:hypothetical protein
MSKVSTAFRVVLAISAALVGSSARPAHAEERQRYFGGEVPPGMHVEREKDATLIVVGLTGFAVSYGVPMGLAMSAKPKDDSASALLIPVAGPVLELVALANTPTDSLAAEAAKGMAIVLATPLFVFDALVQAGSLLAVGLGIAGVGGKDYLVPNADPSLQARRVRLTPSLSARSVAVSLSMTF